MTAILDLQSQTHNSMPYSYVHVGLMMEWVCVIR